MSTHEVRATQDGKITAAQQLDRATKRGTAGAQFTKVV